MPFLNSGTYVGPAYAIKQMLYAIEKDIQQHFAIPTGKFYLFLSPDAENGIDL